jgi:hypothetical protein
MDAFWAVPEWAPADESHLLGSSSVVTKISYRKGSVTYSTFDPRSTDVLRLDFVPEFVTASGKPLIRRKDLDQSGFTFDDSTRVLRIRHDDARDIDVQGKDGSAPPQYITFDDPHLPAGTLLKGQYPSGLIDWGADTWRINPPEGGFGTFNLAVADSNASRAEFHFYSPRIFCGVDVYNAAASDATVTIHSPEIRESSFTIKPGQLQRVRTGWRDVSSSVIFELRNGQGLRFDNLAYLNE